MPFKKKNVIIILLIAVTLLAIIIIKISSGQQKPILSAPVVVIGNAVRGEIVKSESLTGNILPIQQANIYSKVNGNIEKIFVDIGDHVKQNQILSLIDTTIYSENAKQAKANLMQASANYENSQVIYHRNLNLFNQKLIAKEDLDNSKTAMDIAFAQEESAKASYSNTLTQLGYCKISAPFDGYITQRMLDPGAYVTSSGSSQGTIIFTLMNVDQLKSIVNVPEKDVPLLSKIQGILIKADALPNEIFNAKLKKISEAVDLSTRTMAIEVDVENYKSQLKPGMFATITLILDKKPNALILPNEVIQNSDSGNYVYVVNPDSTVARKFVKIGIQQDNNIEILSGVNEQDKIVFVGQSLIKDKMKIKIAKK